MAKKPGPADAELILKLYDLRRESEIRKARTWWSGSFWPENSDDFLKVATAMGTQENTWLRQVSGYWDLAASFVVQGVLNEDLFLEPAFSGEMFLFFAKIEPFLKEVRAKMQSPYLWANVEKVVKNTKTGRERLRLMLERVAARRRMIKNPS